MGIPVIPSGDGWFLSEELAMKTFSISTSVVKGRVTKRLMLHDDSETLIAHPFPIEMSGENMDMLVRKNIAKLLTDGYKPE